MKRIIKMMVATVMTVIMIITIPMNAFAVTGTSTNNMFVGHNNNTFKSRVTETLIGQIHEKEQNETNLESIKGEFIKSFSCISKSRNIQNNVTENKINEFYSKYVDELTELGYQMKIVYKDNYNEKQKELNTNFERLGINEEGVYLILLENNNNLRSTGYGYTDYTYNGKTYKLRKVMITAADNSAYSKASYCDLLKSNSATIIENCLNTAIIAYISNISSTMGTVASICGLNASMFGTTRSSTLVLNCATNWTRIYTEVYSEYYNDWRAGSCIENAKASSYVSGYYYSAITNSMEKVEENEKTKYFMSQNYDNETWRKEQAIISYINNNGVTYDTTGDVKYYHGNKLKITHREDF